MKYYFVCLYVYRMMRREGYLAKVKAVPNKRIKLKSTTDTKKRKKKKKNTQKNKKKKKKTKKGCGCHKKK